VRYSQIHALMLLMLVLLASCTQTPVSPASTPTPTLSLQAKTYLTTALNIMQQHSVNRKIINWATLRRKTFALANGATVPIETYAAITYALTSLNDHHSTFIVPYENAVSSNNGALTANEKPHGQLLDHDIGYLELPTYNRLPTVPASKDYVRLAQAAIRSADQAGVCGWIVDLRNDMGGDNWPMLDAVGPLLGSGVVGWFVYPDGMKTAWSYSDGEVQQGGKTMIGIENAYHLKHPVPPVAVLTGRNTRSAGEAIVVAFRTRPHTRSFGESTAGVPTGNAAYTLSDGAILVLTVALDADRTGQTYDRPIIPDQSVPYYQSQANESSSSSDSIIQAATIWLHAQDRCQG
jgi:carboxyl-terminal processing protease